MIFIESREIILDEDDTFLVEFSLSGYHIVDYVQLSAAKVEYQVVEVREQTK